MNSLLRHMLQESDYLIEQRQQISRDELQRDPTLQRAFARSIEILGEATKQLPIAFRDQRADIPWRSIAGMRDRLIHGYFAVDYDIVWDVVQNKLDELRTKIGALVNSDLS